MNHFLKRMMQFYNVIKNIIFYGKMFLFSFKFQPSHTKKTVLLLELAKDNICMKTLFSNPQNLLRIKNKYFISRCNFFKMMIVFMSIFNVSEDFVRISFSEELFHSKHRIRIHRKKASRINTTLQKIIFTIMKKLWWNKSKTVSTLGCTRK